MNNLLQQILQSVSSPFSYNYNNGITEQGLKELNNLVQARPNLMGPSQVINRNGTSYNLFKLNDGTQYFQDNQGNWFDAQGNSTNFKTGLDGKLYLDNAGGTNWGQLGSMAISGLQALGGLYMGNKMYGLAKDQFKFQKDFANRNLANSIKSYNTALADRANSRYAFEGRPQSEADAYIKKHSL